MSCSQHYFSDKAASKAERFFSTHLRYVEGHKAGQPFILEPWQRQIVRDLFGWVREDGTRKHRIAYIEVPRKNGKALAIDTPIATPNGWKNHGDLRPGDFVFGPDGLPKMVEDVTFHHSGPCYSVEFDVGSPIVAHAGHEWYVDPGNGNYAAGLMETSAIAAYLENNPTRNVLIGSPPFHANPCYSITRCERVGTRTVNCIQVEGGMYLAGRSRIPTHNSTLAAGIALYLLLCDGEERPQVYSCAGDREQASIVLRAAREMVESGTPELKAVTDIRQYEIRGVKKGGWYRATSAEAYSGHGLSPHGIIFDELHTQKKRDLWDAMLSGRGARRQPLVVAISTAGHDRSSICWEMHQRAIKAQANPEGDPTFYGRVWGAADDDDWTSEEVWAKANPNLGVSVTLDFLRDECRTAIENPAAQNTFRNLYLNQWTEQAERWIDMSLWDACRLDMDDADLEGRPCWAALDLANTRDVNAMVIIWQLDDGHYFVRPWFWIPEDPCSERARQDSTQVRNWAAKGHLKRTPGNVTDFAIVAADVLNLCERYGVQALGYDPWGPAPALVQSLQAGGMPLEMLVEMGQGFVTFAAPCKQFERLLASKTIHHDGNPVLRWMAANSAKRTDPAGNIKPDKSASADKIDGIVAMCMALGLAMREEYHGPSVYENRGMVIL